MPIHSFSAVKRILGFGLATGVGLIGCLIFDLRLLQAAELQDIIQRGHLIVGVKDNVRPLGFRDRQGQLQGFEIDLARRLAETLLGNPDALVFRPLANRERIAAVLEDRVDLTIARVTATGSRSRLVSFSDFYYLDGTVLVTQSPLLGRLSDVRKQTVAVLRGSSTIATVRYRLPDATLLGVASYVEARSRLEMGEAVAFAADVSVLSGWIQEYPQYHLIPAQLSTEPLCAVMPKGLQYDDLRRKVNGAIRQLKTDGWLSQRARQWGLPWAYSGWGTQAPDPERLP